MAAERQRISAKHAALPRCVCSIWGRDLDRSSPDPRDRMRILASARREWVELFASGLRIAQSGIENHGRLAYSHANQVETVAAYVGRLPGAGASRRSRASDEAS
jgi:hypothetical protein